MLCGLLAPTQGRTAIIAFHNGVLYSVPELPSSFGVSDFQVRSWDISDPTDPQLLETLGVTRQPINPHGYLNEGPLLVLGDGDLRRQHPDHLAGHARRRRRRPPQLEPADRHLAPQQQERVADAGPCRESVCVPPAQRNEPDRYRAQIR